MTEKKKKKKQIPRRKVLDKPLGNTPNNIQKTEKRGRKKFVIDYKKAQTLVLAQCTMPEMAAALGVSVRTLYRDSQLKRMIKTGREAGLAAIRLAQYQKGVIEGDREMLKHLGKSYLGQGDTVEVTGKNGEPLRLEVVFINGNKNRNT